MLTIYGGAQRYCDGISRRGFLKIGSLALWGGMGLSLTDIMRAEAATGKRNPHKAVIHVYLGGGPSHQDTFDLKPDAPADIRGEFKPIKTNVPGIEICEVFPKLAQVMDKMTIIRTVVGCAPDHDAYQCMTGWPRRTLAQQGGYPAVGSVLAKLQGPIDRAVPPAVGLAAPTQERRWSDSGSPGFLGPAYAPFKPFGVAATKGGNETEGIVSRYEGGDGIASLKLQGLTLDRLHDRQRLLKTMDRFRSDMDHEADVHGFDAAEAAAFDVLTSSKLLDALDLGKEDPKVRERYGDGKPYHYQYDGAPTVNDHLLMARRLVEAGCRTVTLSFGRWDSHSANFDLIRDHGGKLDQCLSALIRDLDERSMLDDVTVIAWGEFGRTPRVNKDAGRDHWPQMSCALLAGGGMKSGQVIGKSNATAEVPDERAVDMQEIVATLYHNVGVDPRTTMIEDRSGRPIYLLDKRDPLPELVG